MKAHSGTTPLKETFLSITDCYLCYARGYQIAPDLCNSQIQVLTDWNNLITQKETLICHNYCKNINGITEKTGYHQNLSEETMINRFVIRTIQL